MKYTFELIGIDEYKIYKDDQYIAKGTLSPLTEILRIIESEMIKQ